jgi:uncharacterized protein HemX
MLVSRVPIAAGVVAVGAGFWYMTSPKQEKLVSRAKELEQKAEEKAGELTNEGAAKAQQLENKTKNLAAGADSPKPLQEMSGRKSNNPFRAE